ncbi:hypothetical protein PRIPAC_77625 [Pristionchus pacificus]|uniref:Uncharacterized protein n=1 Tax=Pristionchus pacificus TaxID=54126 RepID=A0A2A6CLK7_PRIPA|nr:hypothetical protein PRIPAC_77625 [Pristionchus pacificus]|eukprot:PDM78968.1 hypothetical protein PRIPAC_31547 [Pristionchus pacificus]
MDTHLTHDLKIMATSNPKFNARELPLGTRLSSIDRTDLRVITSFYHCAFCRQQLKYDGEKHAHNSHLECGHFVGAGCVKDVLKKVGDPKHRRVHCYFCNDEVHLTIATQTYFMFPCTQLAEMIRNAPQALNDCPIGNCKKFHPHEEHGDEPCLFCTVEKKLKDQKEKVELEKKLKTPATLESIGFK